MHIENGNKSLFYRKWREQGDEEDRKCDGVTALRKIKNSGRRMDNITII